jgi:hypothetical protein
MKDSFGFKEGKIDKNDRWACFGDRELKTL